MIVTRFAPSPTGYLHVGGARTALFCWLLARQAQGRFILRIEDTDQKRNAPTATQQVMDDLRWLGIDWDEGPDVGGPHGPYLQSQRRQIYDEYLSRLLATKKAYYCFDTPDELQHMRDQAQAQKQNFCYPRPDSFPDDADVQAARDQGRPVVVRFAMPDQDVTVNDVVRSDVSFAAGELSDFIIQKSDGFPTYHFACVVDDELMQVTHVIRGQEHLMNTPSHQALQQALGFQTPVYAHISVTVSPTGGKLSKRERANTLRQHLKTSPDIDKDALAEAVDLDGGQLDDFLAQRSVPDAPMISALAKQLGIDLPEINITDFFQSGYVPEALVNFLALLGWNPGDDREIMSGPELIEAFDLARLSKTNSLFDRKKLLAFNTDHMRQVPGAKLLGHFKAFLQARTSPLLKADDEMLQHLLKINEGARTLADVESKCLFLYQDQIEFDPQAAKKVLQKDGAADLLALARHALEALEPWQAQAIHDAIEKLCQTQNVGMGKIAQPIRVAITGAAISPPIHQSLLLLGKAQTLQRIDGALDYLKQNAGAAPASDR